MEDLAGSLMSIPHSAPLYLLYSVSTLPKRHRHGEPLHEDYDGGFEFEFAATGADDDDSSSAAPRACSSDVGVGSATFADQLFRGGVLLPLKLPPRLHPAAGTWSSAASSAATSPTAQQMGCRSSSWSPFASGGRKERGAGGGFDPFAAALEKVRRDGAAPTPRRRARSLSPLRGGAGLISSSRPAAATAQKQASATRPPWQRRRRGVKHFLSTAPRALRPRCRKDDDGVSSYRPGLLVCFGL